MTSTHWKKSVAQLHTMVTWWTTHSSGWFLVAVDGTSTNYFSTVVFTGHSMVAFITANGIFKPAGTVAVRMIFVKTSAQRKTRIILSFLLFPFFSSASLRAAQSVERGNQVSTLKESCSTRAWDTLSSGNRLHRGTSASPMGSRGYFYRLSMFVVLVHQHLDAV